MLRWLALVFALLLIGLQIKLWTDSGGLPEVARLEQAVAAQRAQNRELSLRNEALAAEVTDLKEGDDAVEERARAELGLILPDEVFYRVVEPATQETDD